MSMSKQDFIALADCIREHNSNPTDSPFTQAHIDALASFCRSQNSAFMVYRWVGYIEGSNGPSGGAVKAPKARI